MGAYDDLFATETQKPVSGDNLVAPRKNALSGRNPELQPSNELTLDEILSGVHETTPSAKPQTATTKAIQNAFEARKQFKDIATGAGEAALSTASSIVGAPLAAATGLVYGARGGNPEEQAKNFLSQFVYQPKTEKGQQYAQQLQSAFEASKLPPIMPEMTGFVGAKAPDQAAIKANIPKVEIVRQQAQRPTALQSGGAAAATNQAMLQEAINRSSPELASELRTIDPATVNPQVLENYVKADQLGIKLTKGQATQDPNLISIERNERGLKPQLAEEYAKQNRELLNKAEEIKQRTAEGTYEPDYVANSERAIESFKEINKTNEKAISSAYKDLENLGAGKIEVDSKVFGNNALKALSEKEDIDFLPAIIKDRVDSYANGKSMNFDQYENFRSQVSRETRKAERAGDGNAVHALTLVRGELEKLPLLNETTEAKVIADKARSLSAQEFGLLDKRRESYNPVYADIVNGSADTSNFIPKVVIRSKNADFAKAMDMLKDNPDAIKQLRAGTLDYIISKSKDASGNFSNAKFNQFVGNLDVNKKLTTLFGEDAQQIKDLAYVARLIEAQPRGSFVSTANTAPAAAQLAKQYGMRIAERIPVVGALVEPAEKLLAERRMSKEIKETMRPGAGAGTKLKNIGKEQK